MRRKPLFAVLGIVAALVFTAALVIRSRFERDLCPPPPRAPRKAA
jgi:hypothetical protein